MKRILAAVALLALAAGCARFSTHQSDESWTTAEGATYRKISTHATSTAFFDSESKLTRFRAQQTDHSQSASVGGFEAAASATNVVNLVRAVGEGVVNGLQKSILPIP